MPLKIASFFAGVGGLELGLEWATGGETVFQCENDPYATKVLERHWPGVQRHDDITTLDPADIPDADVWCGGFPCQDISVAGKGEGLSGSRSGLWWEWYERIRLVRPRFVVLENVAAITSRGLDAVLGALAEAGYDAEWDTVGAWEVGAPHRRNRVFVIAYLPDTGEPILRDESGRRSGKGGASAPEPGDDGAKGGVADPERLRQLQPQGGEPEERGRAGDSGEVAHADGRNGHGRRSVVQVGRSGGESNDAAEWCIGGRAQWGVEPSVGRLAHGVPNRVGQLRCLGNAVVPQVAYVVGRRLMEIMFDSAGRTPPGG